MGSIRELPFVRIILPFIVGILLAKNLFQELLDDGLFLYLFILVVFLLICTSLVKKRWQKSGITYLILVLLGVYTFRSTGQNSDIEKAIKPLLGHKTSLIIEIEDFPKGIKTFQVNGTVHILNQTHSTTQKFVKVPVILNVVGSTHDKIWSIGNMLIVKGLISKPIENTNPHGFNYASYLKNKGIYYQVRCHQDDIERVISNDWSWTKLVRYRIRQRCMNTLKSYFTDNVLGIAAALSLGNRTHLDRETKQSFIHSGAIHVLAVSGLHVGIIAFLILIILNRIIPQSSQLYWLHIFFLSLSLLGFSELTGGAPPVQRASLLICFFIIGKHIPGRTNAYNLLFLTAFVLLLIHPRFLFQVSFQLSYAAVLSILTSVRSKKRV